jgi:TatD DNase family protein
MIIRELQIESFRFVLKTLQGKPKFITLLSRRAELVVLEMLEEQERSSVVFHWYSGLLKVFDRALVLGHFFSINPAMVNSPNGRRVIEALPPDRVLTESDEPFVKYSQNTAPRLDEATGRHAWLISARRSALAFSILP